MDTPTAFIATDRRLALMRRQPLPELMQGAVLFADISGFTRLTEVMVAALGEKRASDQLMEQINFVFSVLMEQVEQFRGNVVGFGGDGLTCWFDQDDGLRATTCALGMQRAMTQFASIATPDGKTIELALKIALTTGTVRRFYVGDPQIQLLDIMAGSAMQELAVIIPKLKRGEIRVGPGTMAQIAHQLMIAKDHGESIMKMSSPIVTGLKMDFVAQKMLAAIGTTVQDDNVALPPGEARPWLNGPVFERVQQNRGEFLADIRPVFVLYVKFAGLDYTGDEAVGGKLNTYIRWVQQILARYDGYLLKLTIDDKGNYGLVSFGAPVAHDDDGERAAAAALALRAAPNELGFITAVQMGLHQGRLLTGAFGNSRRAAYDLLGSAANLGSRLMTNAAPGQILASERVKKLIGVNFRFAPPSTMTIEGGKQTMELYPLMEHLPARTFNFTGQIVGRTAEMQTMTRLLDRAVAGQGQIMLIEGAAGIGKSRLVAAVAEYAAHNGIQLAVGVCQSTTQHLVYHPWRQLIRSLLGPQGFDKWPPVESSEIQNHQQWALLNDFLGIRIEHEPYPIFADPQQHQQALFVLVNDLLVKKAQQQPLILVLEDIHWLDQASAELLAVVSRVVATLPILLVLVRRVQDTDIDPLAALNKLSHWHHFVLGELSATDMKRLITELLNGTPTPLVQALVQARAQGNPFCAEEIVLALRAAGKLYQRTDDHGWALSVDMIEKLQQANCLFKDPFSGTWLLQPDALLATVDLGIPNSLLQLALSRVDRLPEACRTTLIVASVIGHNFSVELLLKVRSDHSMAELREQLQILVAHKLIIPQQNTADKDYEFRHHIIQEAIYDALRKQQQQQWHTAVAEALEAWQPQAIELLAYHYNLSLRRDKRLHYLALAAAKAQNEYANQTALNYYNQALTLEERWGWLKDKVEVLHILGLREAEQATLAKLSGRTDGDPFTISYLYGKFYEANSNYELAQRYVQEALHLLPAHASQIEQARCLALTALVARRVGQYDQAIAQCYQALQLIEQKDASITTNTYGPAEAQVLIDLYNHLGYIYRQQGEYTQAITWSERALLLCRTTGNLRGEAEALNTLAAAAYYTRNLETGLQHRQQAIQLQRKIGDLTGEGANLYNFALWLFELGRYDEAEQHAQEALQIHQFTEDRREENNTRNLLGYLYYLRGDLLAAFNMMQHAIDLCKQIGDEAGKGYALCNLGIILREEDNLNAAAEALTACVELANVQNDKFLEAMGQSHLAICCLQAQQVERAIQLGHAARTLRDKIGVSNLTTIDLTTLAEAHWQVGKTKQAIAYVTEALALLQACGEIGPEFPQRDYYICFRILHATGQHVTALNALSQAHELLATRAEKIKDASWRQAFLTGTPMNRAIVDAFAQFITSGKNS